jgi:hypothetical protein
MTYKNLENDEIENKFQLYKLIQKKKAIKTIYTKS